MPKREPIGRAHLKHSDTVKLIHAHSSPRCQHVKVNGVRCGSPAMKRHAFCYFHHNLRLREAQESDALGSTEATANLIINGSNLHMPVLEDANSVQLAIGSVVRAILRGSLDPRTAGLALYGLQTAAINLPNTDFEPSDREPIISEQLEVASDFDCNDLTCPDSRAYTPPQPNTREEVWVKELLDKINELPIDPPVPHRTER